MDYGKSMLIDAWLVVVGMTATEFTIADPTDRGMLDVVGFDTATPEMISQFASGRSDGREGSLQRDKRPHLSDCGRMAAFGVTPLQTKA